MIKNNEISQTTGTTTAIYSTNSHSNTITGNVIKTYSSNPILLKSCTSCVVSGNTILRW